MRPALVRHRQAKRATCDRLSELARQRGEARIGGARRRAPARLTFAAAGPFCPCVTSKETFWPSFSDLKPEAWIAL
jgi:hypothetical protein